MAPSTPMTPAQDHAPEAAKLQPMSCETERNGKTGLADFPRGIPAAATSSEKAPSHLQEDFGITMLMRVGGGEEYWTRDEGAERHEVSWKLVDDIIINWRLH